MYAMFIGYCDQTKAHTFLYLDKNCFWLNYIFKKYAYFMQFDYFAFQSINDY